MQSATMLHVNTCFSVCDHRNT